MAATTQLAWSSTDWLQRCRAGDARAWRWLYQQHHPVVHRLALRMGVGEREAADVCQEVFLRVHRGLAHFRGDAQLSTWIYTIAVREIHRVRRAGALRRALGALIGLAGDEPIAPSPEQTCQQAEAMRELSAVLARMKPKQRTVFVLSELEELSLEEIASVVGAGAETVKSRLRHARAQFERLRRQRTLIRLPLRGAPVLLVLLAAGAALAIAAGLRAWRRPPPPGRAPGQTIGVQIQSLPAPALPPPAPALPLPAPALPTLVNPPRPVLPLRPAPSAPRPIERPALDWPLPASAPADLGTAGATVPAEELVITREGRRQLKLRATATSLSGDVRGTAVSLRLEGPRLRGRIGDATVELWVRAPRTQGIMVEGTIDGREVGFVARPTPRGDLLQGALPGHTVRLEHGPGLLSWLPGCDLELPAVGAGVYDGRCASGARARVVIPATLARMPTPQRLIVLSLLLTETDPIFRYDRSRLFPVEQR